MMIKKNVQKIEQKLKFVLNPPNIHDEFINLLFSASKEKKTTIVPIVG